MAKCLPTQPYSDPPFMIAACIYIHQQRGGQVLSLVQLGSASDTTTSNLMMQVVSKQQHVRAAFVSECLQQMTPAQEGAALAAAGVSNRHMKRHIIDCLGQYSTICSPTKRGRKTRFTDCMLKAAYDLVPDPGDVFYTGPRLRDKLIEDGVMSAPVDTDNLLAHLSTYCSQQGHKLYTTSTGTVFCIHPAAMKSRVAWCKELVQLLLAHPLESWMFEDETQIEEEPHPKCKCNMCG